MTGAPSSREAWSDYWSGRPSGCLPDASSPLERAFRDEWCRVAGALPERARVLDLASGSGAVLGWLLEARPDLDLTGIDLADPLPPPPPGVSVMLGGVAMESLPFEPATFDAIVSQFGLEYGELDPSVAQAARVLRRGGTMALVTHHAAGPIVAHNRTRAAGLKWALDEARLIERAAQAVSSDQRTAINSAPGAAAAMFGPRSAAWEIAEAIARALRMPRFALPGTLATLERKARGEMQRINTLETAAATIAGPGLLQAALDRRGFELVEQHPVVHMPGGLTPDRLTIADFWMFRRR